MSKSFIRRGTEKDSRTLQIEETLKTLDEDYKNEIRILVKTNFL